MKTYLHSHVIDYLVGLGFDPVPATYEGLDQSTRVTVLLKANFEAGYGDWVTWEPILDLVDSMLGETVTDGITYYAMATKASNHELLDEVEAATRRRLARSA